MRQQAVRIGPRGLIGVVTHPTGDGPPRPLVLLLNAGMIHRVGPNRLYVDLSRQLAARGFRVLRFDFSGIGDSLSLAETTSFEQRALVETREAMAFAEERYGARAFVAVGLCSGADVSYMLALQDERVVAAGLINGGFTEEQSSPERLEEARQRVQARSYKDRLTDPESWKRLLTLQSDLSAVGRVLSRAWRRPRRATPAPRAGERDEGEAWLLRIHSEGSFSWDLLQQIFGPAGAQLEPLERTQLVYMAGVDHVFTPLRARAQLIDALCRWADTLEIRAEL